MATAYACKKFDLASSVLDEVDAFEELQTRFYLYISPFVMYNIDDPADLVAEGYVDQLDHLMARIPLKRAKTYKACRFDLMQEALESVFNPEQTCPHCVQFPTTVRGCPFRTDEEATERVVDRRPLRHFNTCMNRILARQPPEHIGADGGVSIVSALRKLVPSVCTMKDVRKGLQALDRGDLLGHSSYIWGKLTGVPPPNLDPSIVQRAGSIYQSLTYGDRMNDRRRQPTGFLIYKILDSILTGDDRRVLSYIHLPGRKALAENRRLFATALANAPGLN